MKLSVNAVQSIYLKKKNRIKIKAHRSSMRIGGNFSELKT